MKQYLKWFGVIAAFLLFQMYAPMHAMAFSEYVPGTLGVNNGTLPPPGWYYENYNQYYWSDTLKDNSGHTIQGIGAKLSVYANVTHLFYNTTTKILGGYYGMDLFIPVLYTDIKMKAYGIHDTQTGLGDMFFDPLVLSWHGKHWDAFMSAGAFFPTGDYGQAASPGKGYWTFMEQLGGTYWFDQCHTWSGAMRVRFEQSTEQPDTHITPGDEVILEYGIGKAILLDPAHLLTLGVGGYSYMQTNSDSGPNASLDKISGNGVGPDIQFTFLKPFYLNIALRYMYEYRVENAFQGQGVSLIFTGPLCF